MYLTRQPRGSHPFVESLDNSAFLIEYGGVAQLGERTVRIRKVKGSNPSVSTKMKGHPKGWSFILIQGIRIMSAHAGGVCTNQSADW